MDKLGNGQQASGLDVVLEPKKYDDRPYVYVAMRPECDCVVAVYPHAPRQKPAGVVLAEWAKMGWRIATVPKNEVRVRVCTHDFSDADTVGLLVYVAEQKCGCVAGVWQVGLGENGAGNVVKILAELGYYIQTISPDAVVMTADCPHYPPRLEQQPLFG